MRPKKRIDGDSVESITDNYNILKELYENGKRLDRRNKIVGYGLMQYEFSKYTTRKIFIKRKKFLLDKELIMAVKTSHSTAKPYSITPLGIIYLLKSMGSMQDSRFLNLEQSTKIFEILEIFYRANSIRSKIIPKNKILAKDLLHKVLPAIKDNLRQVKLKETKKQATKTQTLFKNVNNTLVLDFILDKFDFSSGHSDVDIYFQYGLLKLKAATLMTSGKNHYVMEFVSSKSNFKPITGDEYHAYFASYLVIMFMFALGNLTITQSIRNGNRVPQSDPELVFATKYFHGFMSENITPLLDEINKIRAVLLKSKL